LIEVKGYRDEALPHENTIGQILNRLGYRLRRVQKTKPQKKGSLVTCVAGYHLVCS